LHVEIEDLEALKHVLQAAGFQRSSPYQDLRFSVCFVVGGWQISLHSACFFQLHWNRFVAHDLHENPYDREATQDKAKIALQQDGPTYSGRYAVCALTGCSGSGKSYAQDIVGKHQFLQSVFEKDRVRSVSVTLGGSMNLKHHVAKHNILVGVSIRLLWRFGIRCHC